MTYTLGIPADGQSLGNSKSQVRGNFTTIFNAFAVNHVAFNSLPEGVHKRVDLQEVANPTPPLTIDTLFCKVTSIPLGELFYVRGAGGPPNTPIQLTNGTPVNAASGFTFLPGGMIMQWGMTTLSAGSQANVAFNPTFRLAGVNTAPWSIQVTLRTSNNLLKNAWVSSFAFDNFDILGSSSAAGRDVFWMAIGPRT